MARLPGLKLVLPTSLLTIAMLACSSPSEPRQTGVTLLVTNQTCQIGQCSPIRVLGFPGNGPNTPGGPWTVDLGVLDGPSGCFSIPDTRIFLVIAVGSPNDTTAYVWTPDQPFALGSEPVSGLVPFGPPPSTDQFVPARSAGWKVSLPGNGEIKPAPACTT